ncbi:cell division protein ZapD [Beggiatoa leptomitoformis]|uniref:Cell division protein ZapD n=1 Tax=Beggiatoa leptomitoformis TaxID=288004 RepID=A0A2N9YGV3_9GAMM|nr:cell division protein ZapD [Beggiatoa leptomitoformis]ALG67990.1 cell division protein ZapD [Beggiatoa leptomitoformis]AUI69727.1 cell division protein ZapD [Beggiatoa leptomitoformis]
MSFAKKRVTYEQPLNDRIKNMLRLEYLFGGLNYHIKGPSAWDSRTVVDYIVKVLDVMERLDLREDLIQDLEHHLLGLERWRRIPNADAERVNQLILQAQHLLDRLRALSGPPNQLISQLPLINLIKQRSNIAGGLCRFDVPAYHFWLQKNPKQRLHDINEWLAPLESIREAIELDLYMIRNSAKTSQETAMTGYFQAAFDNQANYQLVRVSLPPEHSCFVEISGGKQRFTIRFFEQPDVNEKPIPTEQDVNFDLCCCMM